MLLIVIKTSTDSANPDLLHTVNQHCIVGKPGNLRTLFLLLFFQNFLEERQKYNDLLGKQQSAKNAKS